MGRDQTMGPGESLSKPRSGESAADSDVEGHLAIKPKASEDEDDTEGHVRFRGTGGESISKPRASGDESGDEDDTEGHRRVR